MPHQWVTEPTTDGKIGLSPAFRGRGFGAFDKKNLSPGFLPGTGTKPFFKL